MTPQDITAHLLRELTRVGRPRATVTPEQNGTVRIVDADGQWAGPAPAARIALDKTPAGSGGGPDFWRRFP